MLDWLQKNRHEVTNGKRANPKYFARGSPQLKKAWLHNTHAVPFNIKGVWDKQKGQLWKIIDN